MAEVQTPANPATPTNAPAQAGAPNRGRGGNNDRRGPRRPDQKPEEKQFEEFVINIDRVSRVVKGGRRFRFKALVVVGDRKSRVGVGVAKGADVQAAVAKATDAAKKTMITIPILEGTIPHEIEAKVSGARILLKPAAPGTGVIAGGALRAVLGVTGINNLLSKSFGSTNKVNIAYAAIDALRALVPKDQWVVPEGTKKKAPAAKKETK